MPADINIRIGAKLDGLQRSIKKAQSQLSRFADFAERTGTDLTTRLSIPILGAGTAAVTAFAKFERLENGLKAIADEGEDVSQTLFRLQKIAQLPGISLEQAVKGSNQLRNVGFEAKQAEAILQELSKAVTLSGEGPEQLQSVVRQLVQMSAKGRILQEDLGVIQENVPSIGIAIQDAFGTNNIDAIRATGVSAQEFTAKITQAIAENEKFQKVQGGLANNFDNFRQSVQLSLATLGKTIAESIDLAGVMDRLSQFIANVTERFKNLSPSTQKFIVIAAGVAAAIGPLTLGLGAIAKVALGAVAAIKLVGGSLVVLAANPIGLAVAAIGGLVAAFVSAYRNSETVRNQIAKLGQGFQQLFNGVGQVFKQYFTLIGKLGERLGFAGDKFKDFRGVVSGVVASILELFTIQLEGLNSLVNGFSLALDGNFKQAGKAIVTGLQKIVPISAIISEGGRVGRAYSQAYTEAVTGGIQSAAGGGDTTAIQPTNFDNVFANIPTSSSVSGTAEALKDIAINYERSHNAVSVLTDGLTRDLADISGLTKVNADNLNGYTSFIGDYLSQISLATEKSLVFGNSQSLLSEKINITRSALERAVEQFGLQSVEVEELRNRLSGLNEEFNNITAQQERFQAVADGIQQIGNSFGDLLARGATSFRDFAKAALNAISSVIGALIKQGVAAAVSNALKDSVIFGPAALGIAAATGTAASAIFRGLISSISPPKLARGGLAFGPTLAVVGDNVGASSDPEVIAPLSKLQKYMNGGGGEFVLRGQDLYLATERAKASQARIAGV